VSNFEMSRSPQGYLMVGSVQEVIDKILFEHELFNHTRFLAQMSGGHDGSQKNIEVDRIVWNASGASCSQSVSQKTSCASVDIELV